MTDLAIQIFFPNLLGMSTLDKIWLINLDNKMYLWNIDSSAWQKCLSYYAKIIMSYMDVMKENWSWTLNFKTILIMLSLSKYQTFCFL